MAINSSNNKLLSNIEAKNVFMPYGFKSKIYNSWSLNCIGVSVLN